MSTSPLPMPAIPRFWTPFLGQDLARHFHHFLSQLPDGHCATLPLTHPGPEAAHTLRRAALPLAGGTMPTMLFLPKQGTGAAVLLLHGTVTHHFAPYVYFVRELLARGIAVMTLELDGHGDNTRPLSVEGVREDVPAALDYLYRQPEVDPARVGMLGLSLGAVCMLEALPAYPGIKAIVGLGIPLNLEIGVPRQIWETVGSVSPTGAKLALELAPHRLMGFLGDEFRVAGQAGGSAESLHLFGPKTLAFLDGLFKRLDPLGALARAHPVPALFINATYDRLIPRAHAEAFYQAAKGPRELFIAPDCNHFTMVGNRPTIEKSVGWLERWLNA